MEDLFYGSGSRGSKKITQQDIQSADATGFGAAADDYMERGIDLNEILVHNKPATFFMRVKGDAMVGASILDGDIAIIDRSIKAASGRMVVASVNGELLIRRLEQTFNKIRLLPESTKFKAIEIDFSGMDFSIWGVVTYVIHPLV
jgi:DNA polymerase V